MGQPRGEGRAVVKGELLAALREFQGLLEGAQLLPQLEDLSFWSFVGAGQWSTGGGGGALFHRMTTGRLSSSISRFVGRTHLLLRLGEVVAGLHLHPCAFRVIEA